MNPASTGETPPIPTIPVRAVRTVQPDCLPRRLTAGVPSAQVEQDHDGDVALWRPFLSDLRTADAQPGRLSAPGSMAGEDEWHLVSPNASQGAASGRSSRT